jgi:hypothetical protein
LYRNAFDVKRALKAVGGPLADTGALLLRRLCSTLSAVTGKAQAAAQGRR